MKMLYKLFITDFKLYFRSFEIVFFAFVLPPLLLLMFGGIYGNEPHEILNGFGTIDLSIPAYTGMILAVTGIISLPLTLAEYRGNKVLKRFRATPLKPYQILLSQVFINILASLIGLTILFIVGKLVFQVQFPGKPIPFTIAFTLSLISIYSLGFIIASICKDVKSANAIALLVYFPMLFLSGASIPLAFMPETMVRISNVLPLTHAVHLLQGVWLGGSLTDSLANIVVLASITIIAVGISTCTFKWE